ncbi:hypothetical protein [Agrobacterium salinitolerans]|uniref:hypothetical protein n=1 Tax=Agrobacterium salinitolerans TaxID=1183413 RepID=UPI001573C267|nr:hypothetical protein [Agrobacterium salinitolerans]NTA37541.1 hypothetical protein [Agrobacterium salinitolerans]
MIAKRNLAEQVTQPIEKTGKTNLGLEAKELATLLEKALVGDFDTTKVSRAAYEIYHQHGLDLTPEMDRLILTLMAMEEGPQFELNESEVRDLMAKLASV